MQLLLKVQVRRFVGLAILLFFAIPFGMSLSGCKKALAVDYCNGGDSGPEVGQVATITLSPALATYGESLDYGQIGQSLSASASDCKGNVVSARSFVYSSTNLNIADINPATGQTCAGTFNRHVGGGVPDFTTCTAFTTPPPSYVAYVTATGQGAVSNAIPVFIHPPVTSINIGNPSGSCLVGTEQVGGSANANSNSVTVPNTNLIATGLGISGPGIPANTLITNVVSGTGTLTLSNNTTVAFAPVSVTGTTTNNLSTVTAVSSLTGLFTGEGITGTGIPVGTTITSFTANPTNSITLSNPATATGTTALATAPVTIIGNPTSNCCPLTYTNPTPAVAYTSPYACVSQNGTVQLTSSIYGYGGTYPSDNITCQAGHINYATQGSGDVVSIDENGVATAIQPGSTTITATISQSGSASTAGFFSTCPPVSIQLTSPGQTGSNITVNLNNSQPITATVKDMNGNTLTGVNLEYNSTNQQTIPTNAASVTPEYPGVATITAVCAQGGCNPAPYSQINYQGNGVPLTSNGITVTTTGSSSTVLYMGSTNSQYLYPLDFTTNQPASPIKLPYVPNSMAINQSGSTIYMGSTQGLMTFSTATNTVGAPNVTVVGQVIAVSPDGSSIVVSDPNKKVISLVTAQGSASTTYGGVATRASWAPDAETVYITGTDPFGNSQLLVHNQFLNWVAISPLSYSYTDVAATVPHIGAYLAAGTAGLDGRTYCPTSASNNAVSPPVVTNSFYPVADHEVLTIDRLAATADGNHMIGATATAPASVQDIALTLPVTKPCPPIIGSSSTPVTFTSSHTTYPLTGVIVSSINNILPSADSPLTFITYTGASGLLPIYFPATSGPGKLTLLPLINGASAASAPVAGTFSTDNLTFYVGTSGDNQVHEIALTYPAGGTPTAVETPGVVIAPGLPCATAACTIATPNLIVQRPKKSTE